MEPSDDVLIKAHLQGDGAAFGELVRRHGDSLMGYLMRLCKDRHQAEDMFQESFSRAYQKAGLFKGRSSFKTWLYTIATNIVTDFYRKQGGRPQTVSLNQTQKTCDGKNCTEALMPLTVHTNKTENPMETASLTEQKAQVQQALGQLPERQRTTVVLAYYQGLSYKEVAQVMGCSLGTVKTQMFRALRTLATLLPEVAGGEL
ncbi:MAG: sigma-70 family RNA polymerase sigma factor [Sedimentisphaerales bacterium]|nr:sigma-70 family RNA polymerase sigma factor [Sedimentisphaerales bacterium]